MLNMLYQAKQLLIEFHQSVIMYVILLYSNCDFNMIELTKRRREVFSTTTVTFLPLFPLLHPPGTHVEEEGQYVPSLQHTLPTGIHPGTPFT